TATRAAAGAATTTGATTGGSAVTAALPTVTVTPGTASPATSTVTTSSSTVVSGATATLTLQAKDGAGNNLTTGGLTVVFSQSGGTSTGTIGGTTGKRDDTYEDPLTEGTAGAATHDGETDGNSAE